MSSLQTEFIVFISSSHIAVLSLQDCESLTDLSGLNNIISAQSIIISHLPINDINSFNNLFNVSDLWIYRNYVSNHL